MRPLGEPANTPRKVDTPAEMEETCSNDVGRGPSWAPTPTPGRQILPEAYLARAESRLCEQQTRGTAASDLGLTAFCFASRGCCEPDLGHSREGHQTGSQRPLPPAVDGRWVWPGRVGHKSFAACPCFGREQQQDCARVLFTCLLVY